jgi:hypothetical protein
VTWYCKIEGVGKEQWKPQAMGEVVSEARREEK